MKDVVVLISGNGSNLQAIINVLSNCVHKGRISAVFSDKASAYGLQRAKNAGIPSIFIDPDLFDTRDAFDSELMRQIDMFEPGLIVLAGYMRILNDKFVQHYWGRIMNIHPSLLPKYPGINTCQRAILSGDKQHGTSVHFVTEQLDKGPVILQARVPILKDDTIKTLSKRIQMQEYKIYPIVIKWFLEDRLKMRLKKVFLDEEQLGPHGYVGKL
ncbi:phosphoribosylglycinamide formyltransferase [Candidatus Photodesmus blepharus]|uniref:Phosphoribosylglycinamide formyltransferase n=1 Tax=Candidatus Photodesmus blepharonis TaxID=1179155 RepID=A0A084CNM4_9GAMM|nr:phosphoribosylglycinamide formyltransferase [Candidatus Photodesmus blepharus]KEY91403.1 phosphoribosylglycinamide formyltransferase [Candidatus Photodesmus blepharus]